MSKQIIRTERIAQSIYLLRGEKVMLGQDLATLYGVNVKVLNHAVKRHSSRFPADFVFQLTVAEFANLKSQIVTSSWGGLRRALPFLEAIRQLMMPPEKPRREIGFHVRETAPRYGKRKRR
jgi:hypothetical protein